MPWFATLLWAALACAGTPEASTTPTPEGAAVQDQELNRVQAQASADASVRAWTEVDVPGWRLFTVSTERGAGGAAVEVGGEQVFVKADAMRALMAAGVEDAPRLAALGAIFLDGGAELAPPLAGPSDAPPGLHAQAVEAPKLEGGALTWWRVNDRGDGLVRLQVNLETFEVERASASALQQQAAAEADPLGAAQADLASTNKYTQLRGIKTLEACPGPGAAPLLVDAMLNAHDAGVREAATRAQRGCSAPNSVGEMIRVLQGDANPKVRVAAAETLGALGGAEAKEALSRAAESDENGDVRFAARRALDAG